MSTDVPLKSLEEPSPDASAAQAFAEVLGLLALFFLFAGAAVPEVNEAHYLAKARHYWDPSWCPRDAFLNSSDAHQVFYWSLGWMTLLFPLPVCAWIGRVITWLLIAWAWQRLSWALLPRAWFSIISAGCCLLLQKHGHMAGEWMVGGFEAKGPSYAFVLFALEGVLRDAWPRAILCLGAATAFHPIVGGWALIASVVAWIFAGENRPSIWSLVPALAGSLAIALLGVAPALLLTRGVSPADVQRANEIYVFYRLHHHLVIDAFKAEFLIRFGALTAIFSGIALLAPAETVDRRLRGFVFGSLVIASAGLAIHFATLYHENPAWILRYYWYRLADAVVPLGVTFVVLRLAWRWEADWPTASHFAFAAASLATLIGMGAEGWQRDPYFAPADLNVGVSDPIAWKETCDWVARNTPSDACFLVPKNECTFKWYAGRAEVVCWKDIPQDARGILDWWQRWNDVHAVRTFTWRRSVAELTTDELIRLSRTKGYDFDYVIVDLSMGPPQFDLPCIYPARHLATAPYAIFALPPKEPAKETAK